MRSKAAVLKGDQSMRHPRHVNLTCIFRHAVFMYDRQFNYLMAFTSLLAKPTLKICGSIIWIWPILTAVQLEFVMHNTFLPNRIFFSTCKARFFRLLIMIICSHTSIIPDSWLHKHIWQLPSVNLPWVPQVTKTFQRCVINVIKRIRGSRQLFFIKNNFLRGVLTTVRKTSFLAV